MKTLSTLLLASLSLTAFGQTKLNIEYLKLTPKEIDARERIINKQLQDYDKLTIGRVANLLEKTYGIYVFNEEQLNGSTICPDSLNNKKNVMRAAVHNIVDGSCQFAAYDTRFNLDKNKVSVSGRNSIYGSKVSGTDYAGDIDSSFLFVTNKRVYSKFLHNDVGLTSSGENHVGKYPVVLDFLEGMRASNLKALDATVIFLNSTSATISLGATIQKDYYGRNVNTDQTSSVDVVTMFPESNKLVPVPQPIIFITKDATPALIEETLIADAPLIFAFNKAVSSGVLPSSADLSDAVAKFPELSKRVEALASQVGREAAMQKTKKAFLMTLFVTGAIVTAPVAIVGVMANPLLAIVLLGAL